MNAPNSSSNALSVRDTTGLVQGNGVSACDIVQETCVVRFFLSNAASVSTGFKNSEKRSYDVVAVSLCRGASATLLPVERTGTQRRGYRRANLLDGFDVSFICGWAADMFRARPEADETGGQLSQNWKPFQQTEHEWK